MVHYVLATEEQKESGKRVRQIVDKMLKPHIEEYESADGGLACTPRLCTTSWRKRAAMR